MDARVKNMASVRPPAALDRYWLTRYVLLRWLGFVYLVAFYAAARQLVPLIGQDGLTPVSIFFRLVQQDHDFWTAFYDLPSLFWLNNSDAWLQVVPWIGVILSFIVLIGYANGLIMTVLWVLYMSIVNAGQEWYSYGWEIQLLETGFLAIFLCPLFDARPFPARATPYPVILLFRWLIVRIMLGSALIKLRGDTCWTDWTALYYFFETQPLPNPVSRWFHFLPHPLLQFGVFLTFVVELGAPWFVFWPRWGRYIAGGLIAGFQSTLIISGNFAFFNWMTILPALACFDDRVWRWVLPLRFTAWAERAQLQSRPCRPMSITVWVVVVLIAIFSIEPVLNLLSPDQAMNTSYDPLHLVNAYGAFGTVGRDRPVIIFEGSDSSDPDTATDWKEYPYVASPWDPALTPPQIAPYQPRLDWSVWFAAMATWRDYPWTLNFVWKLLHNDPGALSLLAGNPFPDHPPKYVRIVLYNYRFAKPGNPEHVYWIRERQGLWLPPVSLDNRDIQQILRAEQLIPANPQ